MKSNLIFIGMPAVGKSTVGIVVAKRLGKGFIDSDLLFLKIENQVNRDIKAENAVISPGGSVVYCEEAMKHFKEIGIVVYLHASYQTIKRRIRNPQKRGVVLKDGQTLKDLYDERKVLFEKYADVTISEEGCQIEETIENVLDTIENYSQNKA